MGAWLIRPRLLVKTTDHVAGLDEMPSNSPTVWVNALWKQRKCLKPCSVTLCSYSEVLDVFSNAIYITVMNMHNIVIVGTSKYRELLFITDYSDFLNAFFRILFPSTGSNAQPLYAESKARVHSDVNKHRWESAWQNIWRRLTEWKCTFTLWAQMALNSSRNPCKQTFFFLFLKLIQMI